VAFTKDKTVMALIRRDSVCWWTWYDGYPFIRPSCPSKCTQCVRNVYALRFLQNCRVQRYFSTIKSSGS